MPSKYMEVTFVLYHRSNILSQHTNHNVPHLLVFYTKLTIIVEKTPIFITNCIHVTSVCTSKQ